MAFATFRDFGCTGCSKVATQFHVSYFSSPRNDTAEERLRAFQRGLVCGSHAGGAKRSIASRWGNRSESVIRIEDLGIEWLTTVDAYLANRKVEYEDALVRAKEKADESVLVSEARFAKSWVERSLEDADTYHVNSGVGQSSYGDRFRDGFSVATGNEGGWHRVEALVEQDDHEPATISLNTTGRWSPAHARAVAQALILAANIADARDVTNGPE